jgi:hypothetical protein
VPSARCLHPRTHRSSAATLEHGAPLFARGGAGVGRTHLTSPAARVAPWARARCSLPRSPRASWSSEWGDRGWFKVLSGFHNRQTANEGAPSPVPGVGLLHEGVVW